MEITTITTPFVLHISVNCYLLQGSGGFVLIDTGMPGRRRAIETALYQAGCQPGNLALIILTHGDLDHTGNAAYFRQKFGGQIAMHAADAGMVEHGDMFANRQPPNAIMRALFARFFSLHAPDRFTRDITLADGTDLTPLGLDATAIHLPGHSLGNTGILTGTGDLFCGDLLANTSRPALWSIIDDAEAAQASIEKLRALVVQTVYPGHGRPFSMTEFWAHSA
ncbi:MAG: MBL fold metallo-hydrolase [Anaerolineae bacterium]|nr:MBL fold metallo-hydrolase [Anaerolineae bacterium]